MICAPGENWIRMLLSVHNSNMNKLSNSHLENTVDESLLAEEARLAKESMTYGKPKIGGPFSLIDHNGVRTTNEDFKGRYMLMYFGFTHCPDICPEELDKMAEVLDTVSTLSDRVWQRNYLPAIDTAYCL